MERVLKIPEFLAHLKTSGGDGSSARHNVYYADAHKEGPSGHSRWKSDDSGGSVDWPEEVWWELKR